MENITITFDPESYAEFMNLDLNYVLDNWDDISTRLEMELKSIMG
jgi:tRNA A37 threonylcarbamoyladenosine dehydratase